MKTVTILLTRHADWFSRFICTVSKFKYSHASLSIDEEEEIFYSFNYKGFVIEKPKKRLPKSRRDGSVGVRMQVPEEQYEIIRQEIDEFVRNKEKYKYSTMGVICCLLHIPYRFKDSYFCSQFVAEVLAQAGIVKLKKKEMLYLPGNLVDGLECMFSGKQVVYDVI